MYKNAKWNEVEDKIILFGNLLSFPIGYNGQNKRINETSRSRLCRNKHKILIWSSLNTLRPGQNGRYFADDIFKYIFLNENVWMPIKISLKFVSKGRINNISALVQMMAWCRPGGKPLSEPMMVSLPTDICVTRPQWVNDYVYPTPIKQLTYISTINMWVNLASVPPCVIIYS